MEFTVIHSTRNCSSTSCPTIYQDENGNFLIQGYQLKSDDKEAISLPEGEDVIMVPADFLMEFVAKKNQ